MKTVTLAVEEALKSKGSITLTFEDLNARYEALTSYVRCECALATEMVGGQPANEDGVRQFVQHHLKLKGAEADQAVRRILHEEVENVTPETGELPEGKVYGVRAVRHTEHGPYIGDWMVKACWKVAMSRLDIFKSIKGTKGNIAEAGRVQAWKYSLADKTHPNLIYLRNSGDNIPAHTYHKEFMGRVQSPTGPVSIIHQSECVEPGSRFAFEMRFLPGKLKVEDVKDTLALMMIVGIGSARSLECGKFRITNAEINL
jgi:hypothetical protein